jgi:hypothetical protein
MELIAVLGQYLLLTFVLPGFSYLFAFGLCFRDEVLALAATVPTSGGSRKDISKGAWFTFLGVIGGLLLSSVAFAFEIFLRRFDTFNIDWFPAIDFGEIPDIADHSLANLFTAMAFMHFNIAVGFLIIMIGWLLYALCKTDGGEAATSSARTAARPKGTRRRDKARTFACRILCSRAKLTACALALVIVANTVVASHLFRRVDCMIRVKGTEYSVPACMKFSVKQRLEVHPKRTSISPNV